MMTAGRRSGFTIFAMCSPVTSSSTFGLDVAQVSRIVGHASPTIALNVYTHLFDDARHAREIRERMADSPFAALLEPGDAASSGSVLPLLGQA
jgi:hypothetical protein